MDWYYSYIEAFKKYAVFSGRERRAAYWYFVLLNYLIGGWVFFFIDRLSANLTHRFNPDFLDGFLGGGYNVGLLAKIYFLATVLPYYALTVRRLHDTGLSGWWALIALAHFLIGRLVYYPGLIERWHFLRSLMWPRLLVFLVLLVLLAQDSEPGRNRYGSNPNAPRQRDL